MASGLTPLKLCLSHSLQLHGLGECTDAHLLSRVCRPRLDDSKMWQRRLRRDFKRCARGLLKDGSRHCNAVIRLLSRSPSLDLLKCPPPPSSLQVSASNLLVAAAVAAVAAAVFDVDVCCWCPPPPQQLLPHCSRPLPNPIDSSTYASPLAICHPRLNSGSARVLPPPRPPP